MKRGVALLLMDEEEFRGIVADAIDALPERFRAEIGRTVIFVVEPELLQREHLHFLLVSVGDAEREWLRRAGFPGWDAPGLRRQANEADLYPSGSIELYGLYTGRTLPDRARAPLAVCPPSLVFIFMGPCLRANVDEDALRFQVRNLVEHELGHHFGLTEAEVGKAHDRKRSQERKNPGM